MSDTQARVEVSARDGIGRIVLDNPRRLNAMNTAMWEELSAALARLAADDAVRCIVIAGAGEKAFCTGADIAGFGDTGSDAAEVALAFDALGRGVMEELRAFPKPAIAEIRGYCIGAGMAIAAACDLRLAETGASFGIPAARLGVAYYAAGLQRLAALVGPSRARMIMYTARRFPAAEAHRIGFVDEVSDAAALAAAVDDLARTIAGNAPLTIAAAKAALSLPAAATEAERAAVGARVTACFRSADFLEGRRAFEEKRPPVFTGK